MTCYRVRARAYYATWESGRKEWRSCWAEGGLDSVTELCGSNYASVSERFSRHDYRRIKDDVWVNAGSTH